MGVRILVVEDQAPVRRVVRRLLERSGYEVDEADDVRAALLRIGRSAPDAVVLDETVPPADCRATLERIRELSDVPVLMLTDPPAGAGRAQGLRAGADDYLIKPFGGAELVSRLDVLVRRGGLPVARLGYEDGWLALGAAGDATVRGMPVPLTPAQGRLLGALVRSAGRPVPVRDLARAGWGPAASSMPGQVVIAVAGLRAALGPGPAGGSPIETLRGIGYRYVPPPGG